MSKRPYFLVDPEAAMEASRRLSLSALGAMATICGLVYCEGADIPADDDIAAAGFIACSAEEWRALKAELLATGDIQVVGGLVLPSATWAKPEMDS